MSFPFFTLSPAAHPRFVYSLEMAYTPRMTLIRQLAEAHGWRTVCGIEVVIVRRAIVLLAQT